MKSCAVSTAIVSACVCTTPIVSARDVMTASIACERERERATRKWAQRALGWMGAWRAGRGLGAGGRGVPAGGRCTRCGWCRCPCSLSPPASPRRCLAAGISCRQMSTSSSSEQQHEPRGPTTNAGEGGSALQSQTGRNARYAYRNEEFNRNSLTRRRQPGAYTLDLREPRPRPLPARGLARGTHPS